MTDAFAVLSTLPGLQHGVGVGTREISEIESTLDVQLPKSYREFLRRFGWAAWGSNEVFGAGKDAPDHMNVVGIAALEHVRAQPLMPLALIPLLNDGAGNHYCLDTGSMKADECPVVFWDHEHPRGSKQSTKRVAQTFLAWMEMLIADRLP